MLQNHFAEDLLPAGSQQGTMAYRCQDNVYDEDQYANKGYPAGQKMKITKVETVIDFIIKRSLENNYGHNRKRQESYCAE